MIKKEITFLAKVKDLQTLIDFIDLQDAIKKKGADAAEDMIKDVVLAIKNKKEDIPFIAEAIQIIIGYTEGNDELKKSALSHFTKHLKNRDQERIRRVAIDTLSKYNPKQVAPRLIEIAKDQTEEQSIRIHVLQHLKKMRLDAGALLLLLDILERNEKEYMLFVMSVLENNHQHADFKATQAMLEKISRRHTTALSIRCRAIELLGVFGDIELIERLCFLSGKAPEIHVALQKMLQTILSKPLNILGIRSENFEHLIKELLLNIGYLHVEVTRSVRDDGVDVIAYKEGSGISNKIYKVIVQCKRYAKNPVDIDVAERLVEDMKQHQAKEGLLITTSTFSQRAREFIQNHQYVELIDREELQTHLDKAFGNNAYCIVNR